MCGDTPLMEEVVAATAAAMPEMVIQDFIFWAAAVNRSSEAPAVSIRAT